MLKTKIQMDFPLFSENEKEAQSQCAVLCSAVCVPTIKSIHLISQVVMLLLPFMSLLVTMVSHYALSERTKFETF